MRRPPRGVPKAKYAARNIYDLWFPNLAPSDALLREFSPPLGEADWKHFRSRFLGELKAAGARRDLELLAAFSHHMNFSIGCYSVEPARCHRSIIEERLIVAGAAMRS